MILLELLYSYVYSRLHHFDFNSYQDEDDHNFPKKISHSKDVNAIMVKNYETDC